MTKKKLMTDETREQAAVLCSALAADRAMGAWCIRERIASALGVSREASARRTALSRLRWPSATFSGTLYARRWRSRATSTLTTTTIASPNLGSW